MAGEELTEKMSGAIVQFSEKHKWCGALGYVAEVKRCGDDYRFTVACTMPNNTTGCDTAYIYSMLSKKEFEPLEGRVILMPKGYEE